MDPDLPEQINYWITSKSKHDCFFNVGVGKKEKIGAIKVLLVAHSEVFQKMLDESPLAEVGDISITDTDPDTFLNFLKCIYGGTDVVVRKLPFESSLKLIYLCEKYLAFKLKEHISSLLVQLYQPLSIDQVLTGLSYPACLVNPSDILTKAISKAIKKDTGKVLTHKSFLDLDSNAIIFIAKQEKISSKEVTLWESVLKWARKRLGSEQKRRKLIKKKNNRLRSCLENIIKYIRFCAMERDEFCLSVVPSKVLTPKEAFEICCSIGGRKPLKLDDICCSNVNRWDTGNQTKEMTFIHMFNNIKAFTDSAASPKFEMDELNWQIVLEKWQEDVVISLHCSSESNKFYRDCRLKFKLSLINHSSKSNLTKVTIDEYTRFRGRNLKCGFISLSFEDLVSIEKGYIKNNAIEVFTRVELHYGLLESF